MCASVHGNDVSFHRRLCRYLVARRARETADLTASARTRYPMPRRLRQAYRQHAKRGVRSHATPPPMGLRDELCGEGHGGASRLLIITNAYA